MSSCSHQKVHLPRQFLGDPSSIHHVQQNPSLRCSACFEVAAAVCTDCRLFIRILAHFLSILQRHPPEFNFEMSSGKNDSRLRSSTVRRRGHGQTVGGQEAVALQSPSSLRLPLRFPPESFSALRLPAQEIHHGRNRAAVCKANGWGFKDTYIYFIDKTTLTVTGNRCGNAE